LTGGGAGGRRRRRRRRRGRRRRRRHNINDSVFFTSNIDLAYSKICNSSRSTAAI
jgi:hypothetical protein